MSFYDQIWVFIKTISPLFVILPALIFLTRSRSLTWERIFLFTAVELGMLGELSMRGAISLWQNNMPVIHLYTMIEFCLLLSVFYQGKRGLLSKKVYVGLLVSFVLAGIANILFYQGIWQGNSLIRSLEGILLISLSLYYFFVLLRDLEVLHPEKTFMFWFTIAILVYFGGNLLLFIYYNHITEIGIKSTETRKLMMQMKYITYILNIFLYILYSIAFLCQDKESKIIPKSSWSAP